MSSRTGSWTSAEALWKSQGLGEYPFQQTSSSNLPKYLQGADLNTVKKAGCAVTSAGLGVLGVVSIIKGKDAAGGAAIGACFNGGTYTYNTPAPKISLRRFGYKSAVGGAAGYSAAKIMSHADKSLKSKATHGVLSGATAALITTAGDRVDHHYTTGLTSFEPKTEVKILGKSAVIGAVAGGAAAGAAHQVGKVAEKFAPKTQEQLTRLATTYSRKTAEEATKFAEAGTRILNKTGIGAAAGASGGFAGEATRQGIDREFDPARLAKNTLVAGAIGGALSCLIASTQEYYRESTVIKSLEEKVARLNDKLEQLTEEQKVLKQELQELLETCAQQVKDIPVIKSKVEALRQEWFEIHDKLMKKYDELDLLRDEFLKKRSEFWDSRSTTDDPFPEDLRQLEERVGQLRVDTGTIADEQWDPARADYYEAKDNLELFEENHIVTKECTETIEHQIAVEAEQKHSISEELSQTSETLASELQKYSLDPISYYLVPHFTVINFTQTPGNDLFDNYCGAVIGVTEWYHSRNMREGLVNYMREHSDQYKPFIYSDWGKYLANLGKPGTPVTDLEIGAFAKMNHSCIVVLRQDGTSVVHNEECKGKIFFLEDTGDGHLVSRLPKEGISPKDILTVILREQKES